ncbi:MAG: peptide chain release factor N(5)-glutamine methyltransferase [Treponema sp.]|jgi:release factor glutamine methyltransferase|nr:peptide chain release factor N(5)-glutamine methyltransferase [Treponema sp.]
MPCIAEALAFGWDKLKSGGIAAPGLDASLLLAEVLHVTREKLRLLEGETLKEEDYRLFRICLDRRLSGECTAWILGRREFWGLDFLVGPDVLVPRPDTEILVERALEELASMEGPLRVLDLCTGSGAVAVALKHERPGMDLWGSDISEKALALARTNADRLLSKILQSKGVNPRINFVLGDLFAPFKAADPFSLIVSNPPYVRSGDIPRLDIEVRLEPRIALDGGDDGLALIRRIIGEAPYYLERGGSLLLEAESRQMGQIGELLKKRGFTDISLSQDLSGLDRVISARFGGAA